jgi:hypothetical protein
MVPKYGWFQRPFAAEKGMLCSRAVKLLPLHRLCIVLTPVGHGAYRPGVYGHGAYDLGA